MISVLFFSNNCKSSLKLLLLVCLFVQIPTILQEVDIKAMVWLLGVILHCVKLHNVSHGETRHPFTQHSERATEMFIFAVYLNFGTV